MSNELYRDFIDTKADSIINSLGGTITPAPANAELYRDFLDRKFDDVINAINNVKIKSYTYKGNGSGTNSIIFPEIPKIVLAIFGREPNEWRNAWCNNAIMWEHTLQCHVINATGGGATNGYSRIDFDNSLKRMRIIGASANYALNITDVEFTVYYI